MNDGNGQIVRLPGHACLYHRLGRCLYEEALNPGYHQDWRCAVLLRWEGVYDDFLDRVESFGLDETSLADLWRRRFERLAEETVECPDYAAGSVEGVPECQKLHMELCLLRLPLCQGQCRHYVLNAETD
jgi:hypothetical protein